ncbi:MAG TPA: hypothetical protein VE911_07690 [Candidatus Nitrosopolaris sp.]|nr:hypothetical protein [Candidatus Nitrosopolaris sp.]
MALALSLTALFALAAAAVDVARLAQTGSETQAVADIAASAAANAMLKGATVAQARTEAQTVVSQNRMGGATASIADADLHFGQWDPQTSTFHDGWTPSSAVLATPRTSVRNLMTGFLGRAFLTSTVNKQAIATFAALGQASPGLPLAIGVCDFATLQACYANNSCMPTLTFAPDNGTTGGNGNAKNSAWALFGSRSGSSGILDYLPTVCGGSGTPAPTLSAGGSLNLTNGVVTSVLHNLNTSTCQAWWSNNPLLVPVVDCTCFNCSARTVGFATIVITAVHDMGTNKGLDLHAIFREVTGPPGGCSNCGTGSVALAG